MQQKYTWQQAVIFLAVLGVVTTLIILGKIPPEMLATPISLLVPLGPNPSPSPPLSLGQTSAVPSQAKKAVA